MATHFPVLPGKSYGQRSLVGYGPRDHKRVGHNLVTKQQQQQDLFEVPFRKRKGTFFLSVLIPSHVSYSYFMQTHTHLLVFKPRAETAKDGGCSYF